MTAQSNSGVRTSWRYLQQIFSMQQGSRSRSVFSHLCVRSFDVAFALVLLVNILSAIGFWKAYERCTYPFQIYRLVSICNAALIRIAIVTESSLRRSPRVRVRRTVAAVKLTALAPAFVALTILGTYWLAVESLCVPNLFNSSVLWLVLCYGWIVGYLIMILVTVRLGLFMPAFFYTVDLEAVNHPFLLGHRRINGFSKQELDSLEPPTLAGKDLESSHKECAICLESIVAGELVRTLRPCGHAFHSDHIESWLLQKSTCPLCRQDITL